MGFQAFTVVAGVQSLIGKMRSCKPRDTAKKKLKIELPYDLTVPLLGIYLEKSIIQKDTCAPMFTAALFTIAWAWKQPKYPLTQEWIKKTQCTYATD